MLEGFDECDNLHGLRYKGTYTSDMFFLLWFLSFTLHLWQSSFPSFGLSNGDVGTGRTCHLQTDRYVFPITISGIGN